MQIAGRFCQGAPASLVVRSVAEQQGSFAPWALPQFVATANPSATVSPSADFPVFPVMRPTFLHRFRDGSRTVSPVAGYVLVTVLSLPPRRSNRTYRSAHVMPCCLRPEEEGSASGSYFVSRPPVGLLALRPGDSLTIPRMALSIGFRNSVSFLPAIQATRVRTVPSVGLSPTEHARIRWTSHPRLEFHPFPCPILVGHSDPP